ncbi:MAG: TIGR03016 family PEP-CTERM system-associated outer membrane protein [Rubrivivax sp.]|nr:TIGR03016 family PEP-CTERM system-associated outer membrane protein [Rubrivivax sp.]
MNARLWPLCVLTLAVGAASPLSAGAQARGTGVSAGLSTDLSYNINSRLGGRDGAEWIGRVTPSVSLQSRTGRVVGSLDYDLTLIERSRQEPSSDITNRLAAKFSAEAVPRHLYIDGSASIAQQSNSAFGLQSVSNSVSENPNRAEVGTASLSPVLRGVLAGAVSVEARLDAAVVNTRRTSVGDNTQTGGSLSMSSALPGTLITWGLSARSTETDFRIGRTTRADSATASLGWQADADLSFSARGGTESQDVQEFESRRTSTWGVGATWRPSPRTRLQADLDDRFFGRGYSVVAEYRLPRTSFTWTSNRDTSDGTGSRFESITEFQQLMALFAVDFPDPVAREAAVRERLTSLGIDPLQVVQPGFVTAAVSVTERHQLRWAWSGLRLNFSAQANRSTNNVIDAAASASARERVRQQGYSANVGYRLSPTSSLAATGSRQMTRGTSTQPSNDLKSASLTWTEQLGRRTNASLSTRYSVFNSATDPYREAAITASLVMRF